MIFRSQIIALIVLGILAMVGSSCSKNVDSTVLAAGKDSPARIGADGEKAVDAGSPILVADASGKAIAPLYYRCRAAIIDSNLGIDQSHLLSPENEETFKLLGSATPADRTTRDGQEIVSHSGYEIDLLRTDFDNVQLSFKRVLQSDDVSKNVPLTFLSEVTTDARSAVIANTYQSEDGTVQLQASCRKASTAEIKEFDDNAKE